MRVLLDENLPRRLAQAFSEDIEVRTVGQCGWKGTRNGDLLRLAEAEFDVFITTDQGIPHQQNLSQIQLGIIILRAHSNRLDDLLPLMDAVDHNLREITPGAHIELAA